MKHVYPISEIPHLWFHQTQDSAKDARGKLYFEGTTIYSYGNHFPIATIVKRNKKQCILLTTRKYSVTTATHIGMVRRAIPDSTVVFNVSDVLFLSPEDNLPQYHTRIEGLIDQIGHTRKYGALYFGEIQALVKEANAYCKFFKLKERFKVPAVSAEKLQQKAQKVVKEQSAKEKQERKEKLAKWFNGESNFLDLTESKVYLRKMGDEVQTSKGARFPFEHCERLIKFIQRVMKSGVPYKHNGHTEPVGVYHIDSVGIDGTVIAGCHKVEWKEIERFGKLQGLL